MSCEAAEEARAAHCTLALHHALASYESQNRAAEPLLLLLLLLLCCKSSELLTQG
jgi:hypothetical protein